MATINKRVGLPQATVINGVDAGGAMVARILYGYENVMPFTDTHRHFSKPS